MPQLACAGPTTKLAPMAALAYIFPPLSGLIAYLRSSSERVRFHGLQAVLLGLVWPAALYVCSWISATATQIAFAVMAVLWLIALVGTAVGRNPGLPGLRRVLASAASESPKAAA
jgi:uncharacterized membrane protein